MSGVLLFGCSLLVAVLLSGLARRSILSTAVLFLVVGAVAGGFGALPDDAASGLVAELAAYALFSVLFTDGMRAGLSDLRGAWRLPGRLLLLGLPLTLVGNAVLAHLLTGVPWLGAFLLGAVLTPTDPVFAAAIIGREDVPGRVRHLLNVESGLNDGLALPVVLLLLAAEGGPGSRPANVLGELAIGVLLGAAVPLAVAGLRRLPLFEASKRYEPLAAVAIALIVLAAARLTKANEFLAAFVAGSVLATVSPRLRHEFNRFGELITELLKLAALLVFGSLVTLSLLGRVGLGGWTFAVLALVAVRPVAVAVALAGSGVRGRELAAVAWFGPKGFASAVYGLVVLGSGIAGSQRLFDVVAVTVALSIVAHSSTDVLVARSFQRTSGPLEDENDDEHRSGRDGEARWASDGRRVRDREAHRDDADARPQP
jgi:NhaP-type Na+/H+ or K+/H+ antiporter